MYRSYDFNILLDEDNSIDIERETKYSGDYEYFLHNFG